MCNSKKETSVLTVRVVKMQHCVNKTKRFITSNDATHAGTTVHSYFAGSFVTLLLIRARCVDDFRLLNRELGSKKKSNTRIKFERKRKKI